MRINQEILNEMKEKSLIVWNRLVRLYPGIESKLSEKNVSDLWFKTWASVAYTAENPNVIRDSNGKRLFEYDHDFELYPCGANDDSMKAAYKRIYKYILECKKNVSI